jgi:hypothetical protein
MSGMRDLIFGLARKLLPRELSKLHPIFVRSALGKEMVRRTAVALLLLGLVALSVAQTRIPFLSLPPILVYFVIIF